MRYRLMASYLGASYQAAVGPSDRDVTLFAAPPPPEEHGFSPAPGGIWRKQVRLDDLAGLWESRPIGSYHGEPCLVLDDLGDRLHIVYLGMDERRASSLGYWEVDRGVFEVVVPRYDVTDLAEERHEFPIALLLSALPAPPPRALGSGEPVRAGLGAGPGGPAVLAAWAHPGPARTAWVWHPRAPAGRSARSARQAPLSLSRCLAGHRETGTAPGGRGVERPRRGTAACHRPVPFRWSWPAPRTAAPRPDVAAARPGRRAAAGRWRLLLGRRGRAERRWAASGPRPAERAERPGRRAVR